MSALGIAFQIQSFLIISLMWVGYAYRRQQKTHVCLMGAALLWDLLLILQVELGRSVVVKAVQVTSNRGITNFHVALAVSTVVGYLAVIYTGRKMLRGDFSFRKQHKLVALTTFILRHLTFLTSFLVMK